MTDSLGKNEPLIPEKSEGYLFGQSIFYVQFNDVEFYVEDTEQESLYLRILSRLFPKIRIQQIFPLGGKGNVLAHAISNKNSRKAVYILDKDFDDLLQQQDGSPNIVYLRKYSIENYVLERNAITQFIVSENPVLTEEKVEKLFNSEDFIQGSIQALRFLFAIYFSIQVNGIPDVRNCGLKVGRFTVDRKNWEIDPKRIAAYKSEVEKVALVLGVKIDEEVQRYAVPFELDKTERYDGDNISGKYLVALLLNKIVKQFDLARRTDDSSGLYRLAEYCTFDSLDWMKERVETLLSAQ